MRYEHMLGVMVLGYFQQRAIIYLDMAAMPGKESSALPCREFAFIWRLGFTRGQKAIIRRRVSEAQMGGLEFGEDLNIGQARRRLICVLGGCFCLQHGDGRLQLVCCKSA